MKLSVKDMCWIEQWLIVTFADQVQIKYFSKMWNTSASHISGEVKFQKLSEGALTNEKVEKFSLELDIFKMTEAMTFSSLFTKPEGSD